MANPTARIRWVGHDSLTLTLKMALSSEFGDTHMTRSSKQKVPAYYADRSFPYVLVCSTFGTVVSLAAVWISTALHVAPMVA